MSRNASSRRCGFALSVVWALVPACRGCGKASAPSVVADDAAPTSHVPTTITAACDEMAREICATMYEAFDDAEARFGDADTCRKQNAARCKAGVSSASGMTVESLRRCTDSIAAAGRAWWDAPWDEQDACQSPPGKLPPGTACAADTDCASLFCMPTMGDPKGCGTCKRRAKEGEACDYSLCEAGLRCDFETRRCGKPSKGEACGAFGCEGVKDCVAGRCVPYGRLGQACDTGKSALTLTDAGGRSTPLCDLRAGFDCELTKGVCAKAPIQKEGERCGFGVDPAFMTSACRNDLVCTYAYDDAGIPDGAGVCGPVVAAGGACKGTVSRSECAPPSRCIAGRCTDVRVEDCAEK